MLPLAVVTGANGVFGRYICAGLAASGRFSRVIGVVRDNAKWDAVVEAEPDLQTTPGVLASIECNLEDPQSIQALASSIGTDPVGCLVNAAAVTFPDRRESPATGEEMQWAVNVLGYHRMIKTLLPNLRSAAAADAARPSRVVNVASTWAGGLDLADPQYRRRPYKGCRPLPTLPTALQYTVQYRHVHN
eukprot:m.171496 g.171496  ORF g.171496 m.171496 type:complete len:189 (-) comp24241_c0_seq1:720-1286(-)